MKKQTKQQKINQMLKASYSIEKQIADLKKDLRKVKKNLKSLVLAEKTHG